MGPKDFTAGAELNKSMTFCGRLLLLPGQAVRSSVPFLHTFCADCLTASTTVDHQGCLSGSFIGVKAFGYLGFQAHPGPSICCHVSWRLLGALSAPAEVLAVWETSPNTTLEHSTVDHTSSRAIHLATECWFQLHHD